MVVSPPANADDQSRSNWVTANDQESYTVTLTVRDEANQEMAADPSLVVFDVSSSTVSVSAVETVSPGVFRVSLTSKVASASPVVTVTYDGQPINNEAGEPSSPVPFKAGPVAPGPFTCDDLSGGPVAGSNLSVDPASLEVGQSSRLTAQAMDQYCNPVPGVAIDFGLLVPSDTATLTVDQPLTDDLGQAYATLTDSAPGEHLVGASVEQDGVVIDLGPAKTVTFTEPITPTPSQTPTESSTPTETAEPTPTQGPTPSQSPTSIPTSTPSASSSPTSTPTPAPSTSQSPTPADVVVEKQIEVATTTGGSARLADGADPYTIVTTVTDGSGQPVTGLADRLGVHAPAGVLPGPITDNGDGTYSFTVAAATPGNHALAVLLDGLPVAGPLPVNFLAADVEQPALMIGSSQQAEGLGFLPGEQVTVTVYSEPLPLGTHQADDTGRVQVDFPIPADFETGSHKVQFVGAESGAVEATFAVLEPGTFSPTDSSYAVTPLANADDPGRTDWVVADGSTAYTVTLTALDVNGSLLTDLDPSLLVVTTSPGVTVSAPEAVGDGRYQVRLTSTVASSTAIVQSVTFAGQPVASDTGSATSPVPFKAGTPQTNGMATFQCPEGKQGSHVTVSPTEVSVDGKFTVEAYVTDLYCNPVPGAQLSFGSLRSGYVSSGSGTTNDEGWASAELTALQVGSGIQVGAMIQPYTVVDINSPSVTITEATPSPSPTEGTSTPSSTPSEPTGPTPTDPTLGPPASGPLTCADGRKGTHLSLSQSTVEEGDSIEVTAWVTDQDCNPLPGVPVTFGAWPLNTATIQSAQGTTDESGAARTRLTGVSPGQAFLGATANQNTVVDGSGVTVTVVPSSQTPTGSPSTPTSTPTDSPTTTTSAPPTGTPTSTAGTPTSTPTGSTPTASGSPTTPGTPSGTPTGTPTDVPTATPPTPATPTVTAPRPNQSINNPTPTLSGTGTANLHMVVTTPDGSVLCATTVTAEGTWTCQIAQPLPDGPATWQIRQVDATGNLSQPHVLSITIDTVPPNQPTIAVANAVMIAGTVDADARSVVVTTADGQPICQAAVEDGKWFCPTPDSLRGATTINAVAIDQAGNLSSPTTLNKDIQPAAVSVDFPVRQPLQPLTVTGTNFTPGETVCLTIQPTEIEAGCAQADSQGQVTLSFTVPATLQPGTHLAVLQGEWSAPITAPFAVVMPTTIPAPTGGSVSNTPRLVALLATLLAATAGIWFTTSRSRRTARG